MKVAYNITLRRFMRLPWWNSASEMFVNLNIRSLDEMLRIFTFGFMSRVIVSNNVLISNIYNSPCRLYSNIWSWWDSLLLINRVNLWSASIYLQEIDFYYSFLNLFICDVDSIYTNILLVVFIQCFFIFSVIIYGLWVCNKRLNILFMQYESTFCNLFFPLSVNCTCAGASQCKGRTVFRYHRALNFIYTQLVDSNLEWAYSWIGFSLRY